jgi:hypothetical protein
MYLDAMLQFHAAHCGISAAIYRGSVVWTNSLHKQVNSCEYAGNAAICSTDASFCTTYRSSHLLLATANTTLYTANTMTLTGSAAG